MVGAALSLLVGVALIHYSQIFSSTDRGSTSKMELPSVSDRGDNRVFDSTPNFPENSELAAALDKLEASSEQLRKQSTEAMESIELGFAQDLVQICTFQNLEMNDPVNNAGIFMKKYYGLDGEPALGPTLVNTILKEEISWALKVAGIHPWGDGKSLIIATAANNVCDYSPCTNEMYMGFVITTSPDSEIVLKLKTGDYLYVEGALHLWEPGTEPSAHFLHRLHIHPRSYRFSEGGLTNECKEAVSRVRQASKEEDKHSPEPTASID